MADQAQWEYRVASKGGAFRSLKDEEIEQMLNEWGEEGWELVSTIATSSDRVIMFAKRPLTAAVRRHRTIA